MCIVLVFVAWWCVCMCGLVNSNIVILKNVYHVAGFENIGSTVSKFGGSRLHQYCSGLVHPTLILLLYHFL